MLIYGFLILFCPYHAHSQVVVKRILVNNKNRNLEKNTLQLSPSENEIFLEFNKFGSDSTTYFYRLQSLEGKEPWFSSAYPTAHFQNIEGGEYVFQIKTATSKTTEIKIIKENTILQEWWFYPAIAIYIMILIGVGIYLFFLYDFRQKLRLQGVRNQISADLHDEVGSNLNSIAIFVEVLRKKATPEMLPILEKIIENSKESVALMQDTIWTINPKNDSIEKLFERMRSFASQFLANSNISLDFEIEADLKKVDFTMEQRKNIYLIFKEAINNIVKHAQASKASVTIKKVNDTFCITIEDNGKGFDTMQDFEGNGLQNFKTRAEEAEIECIISSKINGGTKVEISALHN